MYITNSTKISDYINSIGENTFSFSFVDLHTSSNGYHSNAMFQSNISGYKYIFLWFATAFNLVYCYLYLQSFWSLGSVHYFHQQEKNLGKTEIILKYQIGPIFNLFAPIVNSIIPFEIKILLGNLRFIEKN